MIKSMTAFARAERKAASITVRLEVRTYNSRHLDVALKLTHGFEALEERIKSVIAEIVARGRVEMRVQIQDDAETGAAFELNLPRARAWCDALALLQRTLEVPGTVTLDTVLEAGNILQPVEVQRDTETIWRHVEPPLRGALTDLDAMRRLEGENLVLDLDQRLAAIAQMVEQIADLAARMPEIYRQRLQERIAVLTRGTAVALDEARLAQEAALLADRSDISEELVRVRSHIHQFRALMADGTPAGRPLNFLLQEFNREFNTMGSKAGQAAMAHIIVAAKSELEKLREQIQNVE